MVRITVDIVLDEYLGIFRYDFSIAGTKIKPELINLETAHAYHWLAIMKLNSDITFLSKEQVEAVVEKGEELRKNANTKWLTENKRNS